MSDFDHGLDLSHLTVWPPQPTTIAGIGLIALAIFQPELAIPALVTGLLAIIGDDKTHLNRTRQTQETEPSSELQVGSSGRERGGRVPVDNHGQGEGQRTESVTRERSAPPTGSE
jgi:hypothetical protein